jgi:hypothetical protein
MKICGNLLILQTVFFSFRLWFLKANWESATGHDNNKMEQLSYFMLAANSI